MKIKFIIFIAFLCLAKFGFSNTDSLATFINSSKDLNKKFIAINDMLEVELKRSPKKALPFTLLQLKIAKVDTQIARANLNVGLAYDYLSKFDSANYYYNVSLKLYEKQENKYWQAQSLLNLGIVNYYKGDLDAALQYNFNALKIFETLNNEERMSSVYNNLGNIYKSKNQMLKAIDFHNKSLQIDLLNGDSAGISGSYNNIGLAFRNLNKMDSALHYYEKALEIKRSINDLQGVARCLTNIGQFYFHLNDFDKCLQFNLEALALERKLGNERGLSKSYINIAMGYLNADDLNSATFYMERGYNLSKKLGILEDLISASEGLAAISSKKENYKAAFNYYQDYSIYKDSLLNKENSRQMEELDAIYQNESKQKEIVMLNREKVLQQTDIENQKLQKIIMGVALFSALIILLFIIRGLQQKKKINAKLEAQKQIVEGKNIEITDSINYAKRIQKAVLQAEERDLKNFPNHFILFKPKDIVSGDFYWMLEKNDDIYITAADCTGHGVPGAFMSMLGIAFLNEITAQNESHSPAEILNQLRFKIIKELGQKGELGESRDGMDMSMIKYNIKDRKIEWAGANNPLWMISSNKETIDYVDETIEINDSEYHFCEIKANKQPIGYSNNLEPFVNHKLQLDNGDSIYLFSDGFADQFGGEKGKKFMKKRFKNLLIENEKLPMEEQRERLEFSFNNWKGDIEQLDDVCVIGIRV